MGALSDFDELGGYGSTLDDMFNAEILMELAVVGIAGGATVLGATFGAQQLAKIEYLKGLAPVTRARVISALVAGGGLIGAAALYNADIPYNRQLAMGLAGGAVGIAIANLAGSFLSSNPLGAPLGEVSEDDESMLSSYDYEALNGLAETSVEAGDPAFRQLGPSAGSLAGVMVNSEALAGYAPYLS